MREQATALPVGYERGVAHEDRSEVRKRGIAAFAKKLDIRSALSLLRAEWRARDRAAGRPAGGPLSDMEQRERRLELTRLEIEADDARKR